MASLKDLIVTGPARFLDKLYGNLEGNAATASRLGTSTVGASDRPIYLSGGTATSTTYRMAATNAISTSAHSITTDLPTGIWYVNGTSDILGQSDGVAIVNQYNSAWLSEIYQDYRTGQIAIRGKNNGTWQPWRTVLDSTNYNSWAVPKIEKNANAPYPVYRAMGNIYKGGTAVSYYRIALPQATSWGMFMMKLAIRESYSIGSAGEIIIYANHSSSADWNQFSATCVGNLSTNIKVYGSDKKYFYIGGSFSYGGLSIELMTVGDSAASIDLSNVTIDTVTELPSTYQTATMCYSLHSTNYASHLDSHYVTLNTEQTINGLKIFTANPQFRTTNYTSTPIQLFDDGTDYGHTMLIGAGGTTYVGAGESANTLYSKLAVKSTEDLILGADSSIRFYTGADSATTTSGIILNSSNQFYPQTNNAGSLGISSYKWGSIYSNKGYFGGTSTNTYALNTSSFICDSWIRTKGETGWYNETYSGGWYMNDTTWVKVYNGKKVYVNNTESTSIKTEGGIAATSIETSAGYPIFRLADDISMSSLGTSAAIEEYIKLYIKSICSKYPGKNGVFRGRCSPNSVAYVEVYMYDTSRVDSTTGLPEYCFGTWRQYSNTFYKFWTANYTFGIAAIVDSSNFSSILDSYYDSRYLKLSGGTMTGALNLKNGTWNKAGDDSQFGDNNTAGSFAIQGLNGATNLKMVKYGDANNYGTITWDGTYFISSGHLALPASKYFYMTYNNTKYPIIYNHDNGNVSLRACGSGLYVGYGDTTGIYFGPTGNWGSITSSGYSGNAASATKLATARTIFGKSFDGTGNVAGQPLVYGAYTATASARYSNSGIQVRENGLVGSAQSDMGYAPSIGFHWSGRIAATLNFHSDGIFYFRKQDGTSRATIDANVNGNASSASSATYANRVLGSYTGSGGQQNPNYFGMNRVGFLMMNTTVNSNSNYKDWIIMDCYSGSDVGGGVAFGVNRQQLGAYIMGSDAARTSWTRSAELYGTHNIIYSSTEPTAPCVGAIWLKPV